MFDKDAPMKGCRLSRTVILRLIFVASLMVAAGVCGATSYIVIRNLEQEVGVQTYESVAASALQGAQAITLRKLQGAEVMSSIISNAFPDEAEYPFVALDGYIETAGRVAALSSSSTHSFVLLVEPEEVADWEAFAQETYIKEGRPEGVGSGDYGFGIWKFDNKNETTYPDGRLHDTTGEVDYESNYTILMPISQHNKPAATSIMYNIHEEVFRGTSIDSMFVCAEKATNTTFSPSCSVVTDFIELVIRPGPAALLFHPVYPANNKTTVVGVIVTSVNWEEVLTNVVPDYVDGLICVISTETTTFTYAIHQGLPQLLGEGDLHDTQHTERGHSVIVNDIQTDATATAFYTLTVYPSDTMFAEFRTKSPLAVLLGLLAFILVCTILFFIYDFLMRHEAHQRQQILDMKRRFVRFISHEIRTPLNTVCMGLELLESDLRVGDDMNTCSLGENGSTDDIAFWYDIIIDIKENANSAVTVLNDLLNYDKIESGTLKLELGTVDIWGMIKSTVRQFQIQAANKKIDMDLAFDDQNEKEDEKEEENGGINDLCRYNVIGDEVRLTQVIRNLISNALKFTPVSGSIKITAFHVPNGLADATPLALDEDGADESAHPPASYPRAGSVRICVQDSGVGMTNDQLSRLFNEGVQFDANKLQAGGGSGLGLCIAKGIVQQHSGTIHAESDGPDLGCRFVAELPLYDFPSEKENGKLSDGTGCSSTVATGTRSENMPTVKKCRRILVVEDVMSSRKMLVRLLERSGHTCIQAGNGEEAVTMVAADMAESESSNSHVPIDTVLIDFEMPVLNGPEATKELRRMGYKATILGVTGNLLVEDVNYFIAQGADEVLPKPMSMAILEKYWIRHPEK
jgi:signal transduction histidine kinase/CheY-like chemotaxis protein